MVIPQFPLIRIGILGALNLCSFIVLGIAGSMASKNTLRFTSPKVGVAFSVITLVIAIPALVVAVIRPWMFTPAVLVPEIAIVAVLWIFWLSTAGSATHQSSALNKLSCDNFTGRLRTIGAYCNKAKAFQGFSWLIWLILTAYLALLVFTFLANRDSTDGSNVNKGQSFASQATVPPMMHTPQQPPSQLVYQPGSPMVAPVPMQMPMQPQFSSPSRPPQPQLGSPYHSPMQSPQPSAFVPLPQDPISSAATVPPMMHQPYSPPMQQAQLPNTPPSRMQPMNSPLRPLETLPTLGPQVSSPLQPPRPGILHA